MRQPVHYIIQSGMEHHIADVDNRTQNGIMCIPYKCMDVSGIMFTKPFYIWNNKYPNLKHAVNDTNNIYLHYSTANEIDIAVQNSSLHK